MKTRTLTEAQYNRIVEALVCLDSKQYGHHPGNRLNDPERHSARMAIVYAIAGITDFAWIHTYPVAKRST